MISTTNMKMKTASTTNRLMLLVVEDFSEILKVVFSEYYNFFQVEQRG